VPLLSPTEVTRTLSIKTRKSALPEATAFVVGYVSEFSNCTLGDAYQATAPENSTVTTVMSSNWPKAWAASAMLAAGWRLSSRVRSSRRALRGGFGLSLCLDDAVGDKGEPVAGRHPERNGFVPLLRKDAQRQRAGNADFFPVQISGR